MSHVTRWLWSIQLKSQLAKTRGHRLSEGGDKAFSKTSRDYKINGSRDLVDEMPST